MKRISPLLLLMLLTLTLSGCGRIKQPKTLNIGILQIVQHGSLDAARDGFETQFNHEVKRAHPKWRVHYNYQNAQGDQANLNAMAQQLTITKPQLVLAIGTPAAQVMARKTRTIPVLTTAVTNLVQAGLVQSNQRPQTNVSGTSDQGPVTAQIKLLTQLTKHSKQPLGIIYNSSEANSLNQVNTARTYAKAHQLQLKVVSVSSANDIQSALVGLTPKVAGLYVPTDNLMASSMKLIGKQTQRAHIPVVTGSIEMAIDGGTATYGLNYRDLGKQTAKMAAHVVLKQQKPATMPVQTAQHLQLYINQSRTQALGINPQTVHKP